MHTKQKIQWKQVRDPVVVKIHSIRYFFMNEYNDEKNIKDVQKHFLNEKILHTRSDLKLKLFRGDG